VIRDVESASLLSRCTEDRRSDHPSPRILDPVAFGGRRQSSWPAGQDDCRATGHAAWHRPLRQEAVQRRRPEAASGAGQIQLDWAGIGARPARLRAAGSDKVSGLAIRRCPGIARFRSPRQCLLTKWVRRGNLWVDCQPASNPESRSAAVLVQGHDVAGQGCHDNARVAQLPGADSSKGAATIGCSIAAPSPSPARTRAWSRLNLPSVPCGHATAGPQSRPPATPFEIECLRRTGR
jgi:hypothetical protein